MLMICGQAYAAEVHRGMCLNINVLNQRPTNALKNCSETADLRSDLIRPAFHYSLVIYTEIIF